MLYTALCNFYPLRILNSRIKAFPISYSRDSEFNIVKSACISSHVLRISSDLYKSVVENAAGYPRWAVGLIIVKHRRTE